ncbi:MAG: hypothetical protein SFU91_06515 [Chloroherpetonaceae bacterium]|nr:hypothetical protein [Chloroherpetonaceae bacterium]
MCRAGFPTRFACGNDRIRKVVSTSSTTTQAQPPHRLNHRAGSTTARMYDMSDTATSLTSSV